MVILYIIVIMAYCPHLYIYWTKFKGSRIFRVLLHKVFELLEVYSELHTKIRFIFLLLLDILFGLAFVNA